MLKNNCLIEKNWRICRWQDKLSSIQTLAHCYNFLICYSYKSIFFFNLFIRLVLIIHSQTHEHNGLRTSSIICTLVNLVILFFMLDGNKKESITKFSIQKMRRGWMVNSITPKKNNWQKNNLPLTHTACMIVATSIHISRESCWGG